MALALLRTIAHLIQFALIACMWTAGGIRLLAAS